MPRFVKEANPDFTVRRHSGNSALIDCWRALGKLKDAESVEELLHGAAGVVGLTLGWPCSARPGDVLPGAEPAGEVLAPVETADGQRIGYLAVALPEQDWPEVERESLQLIASHLGYIAETQQLRIRNAALEAAVENLRRALVTSRSIGAAIGILMDRHKITKEQAFDLLRQASQRTHRKLYQTAEDVLNTGEIGAVPLSRPNQSRPARVMSGR
jgi:ANTAR domain